VFTIGVNAGWADPETDPTRIDWPARQATAAIPFRSSTTARSTRVSEPGCGTDATSWGTGASNSPLTPWSPRPVSAAASAGGGQVVHSSVHDLRVVARVVRVEQVRAGHDERYLRRMRSREGQGAGYVLRAVVFIEVE